MRERSGRTGPGRLLVAGLAVAAVLLAPLGVQAGAAARADCSSGSDADFNGDGFDDAVVGDPFADVRGRQGAGAAYVLLGGADGPGTGGQVALTAPDGRAGDGFGWSVRTGHVDDDRCLDVLVGAPYADPGGREGAGAVYVFSGAASGRPGAPEKIVAPAKTRAAGAHFGWSLAAAKDTAGFVLAIGAPFEDDDGVPDAGAVYLRHMVGPGWALDRLTQENEGVIGNSEPGDEFGWALALGHLGGRAGLDLAVGVPFEDTDGVGRQNTRHGVPDTGSVTVVYDVAPAGERGGNRAFTSDKWELQNGTKDVPVHKKDMFGYAVDYAEWRDAGYLAVGAPGADSSGVTDSGMVQLFKAASGGKTAPLRVVRTGADDLDGVRPAEHAALGWSVALWNPHGVLSLAVGSPFETFQGNGSPESGLVREVTVTGIEPSDLIAERKRDSRPYEHFGWSVTDVGGADGLTPGDRLLVGIPDERDAGGGAVAHDNHGLPTPQGPGKTAQITPSDYGSAVSG